MHTNSDCIPNFADGTRCASADFFRSNAYAMRNYSEGMRSGAHGMNSQANCIRNGASGIRGSADDIQNCASTIRRKCVNRMRDSADY